MKKNNGFTLLELLVVIGIIGVIMALATVAYTSTQRGGRDARRKQDLVAIQNALEQFYSANTYEYPSGVDYSNSTCKDANVLTYLRGPWPVDPGTDLDYSGSTTSCDGYTYCICAEMEGANGPGNSVLADCVFESVGVRKYYCVTNLQ